jgi:hypothetical protein
MLQAPHFVGRSSGHHTGHTADSKYALQAPTLTDQTAQQSTQDARKAISNDGVKRLPPAAQLAGEMV